MQTYTENSLKTSNKREESSTTLWRQTVCLPWGYWDIGYWKILFHSCHILALAPAADSQTYMRNWWIRKSELRLRLHRQFELQPLFQFRFRFQFQVQVQLFLLSAWMLALAAVLFRPCRHESGFWYLHNIAMRWLGVVTAIWSDVGAGPFRDNQDRMATIKRNEVAPLTYIHSYGHSHSPPRNLGNGTPTLWLGWCCNRICNKVELIAKICVYTPRCNSGQ